MCDMVCARDILSPYTFFQICSSSYDSEAKFRAVMGIGTMVSVKKGRYRVFVCIRTCEHACTPVIRVVQSGHV